MKLSIIDSVPFSQEEYQNFLLLGVKTNFSKNEFLLSPGQRTDVLYVIVDGLVRGYRLVNDEEVTHHFFRPGWFATDYYSYLTGTAGDLFLETLTETTAVKFAKHTFVNLFSNDPRYETLGRILAEKSFLVMARRVRQFQTKDLKSRYLDLVGDDPGLFESVPQKHIASYLGVAPQSLSRIKASLNYS